MKSSYRWIHDVWYQDAVGGWILLPLAWLYAAALGVRSVLYRCKMLKQESASVPVVVVGNITAGGTGKTPTVLWLVNALKERGYKPGIVSRGYGGSHSGTSMRVDADSSPSVVGDEPVLLAQRSGCPVVVDADRVRATRMLVEDGVDVVVTDDGLQHRRLRRDFEICVVDGARGLGNGRLLPAGPLRESASRLRTVDAVLVNGSGDINGVPFELQASDAVRLNGSVVRPLGGFRDTTVHAVAAIGNPDRFFNLLRTFGIQVIEHGMADHAALSRQDIEFADDFDVFMTEKDAVKIPRQSDDKYWYVPVDLTMDDHESERLLEKIESRLKVKQND